MIAIYNDDYYRREETEGEIGGEQFTVDLLVTPLTLPVVSILSVVDPEDTTKLDQWIDVCTNARHRVSK